MIIILFSVFPFAKLEQQKRLEQLFLTAYQKWDGPSVSMSIMRKSQKNQKNHNKVNKQYFLQVFQRSEIEKMEDNLTSADPLSYATTGRIPGKAGKQS